MTRWAPDAALRLEEAALALFEEQGYTATTVPQITARAGLTTRTFFRHFADKRDVLFLRDREFPLVVEEALGCIEGGTPLEVVRSGLVAAVEPLEQWRAPIGRRRAVIRSEPRLRERELLKSAHLADAVAAGLQSRGVAAGTARLLAGAAVLVFERALEAWLDDAAAQGEDGDGDTLAGRIEAGWRELARAIAPLEG